MPTYVFPKVELRVSKTAKCLRCAKRLKRSTTITHTVNPFNKRPDGVPKTHEEVGQDVAAKAEAWKAEPVWCDPCGDVLRVRAEVLAAGDVLVLDDGTEVAVAAVEHEDGKTVVNPGPSAVWRSDLAWVTRYPAWDLLDA